MHTMFRPNPARPRFLACVIGGVVAVALILSGCGGDSNQPASATSNEPAPNVSTPDKPTPNVSTPDEPTPNVSTPDEPVSNGPIPNETTPAAQKLLGDIQPVVTESGMQVCVSVLDLSTGDAARIQSDQKMASASMIKVLIAEEFLKQVAAGKFSLDGVYVLQDSDIVGGTGSLQGLGAGAEVTYRELLHKMISESDNVATNVLITLCDKNAINAEAKALGLANTELNRLMMDTDAIAAGIENYTSADDLTTLFRMVYNDKFVNPQMSAVMREALEAQEDNECISQGLPEGVTFAHKTGTLATVRHDGGIVEGEKPFIIVTLCGGDGFSEDGALSTMASIGSIAYRDIATTGKAVA